MLDFERETSGYMRKWEGTSLSGERTKKGEDEKMQGIFRKQQVDEVYWAVYVKRRSKK